MTAREPPLHLPPDVFERVAARMRELVGFDLRPDKHYLLESRLRPVARAFGMADVSDLLRRFGERPDGRLDSAVSEALATGETSFFRDTRVFDIVRRELLPALLRRAGRERVRIWSAASSTGQEAYSLAMLCTELIGPAAAERVEIVGTDYVGDVLARARSRCYSAFEVQRGVPAALLVKHFERVDEGYRVKEPVARLVRFARHNLLDPPLGLGRFDLVLLRNVLIYMDEPTRRRVLKQVASAMHPHGYLIVGASESLRGFEELFVPHSSGHVVYRPTGRAAGAGTRACEPPASPSPRPRAAVGPERATIRGP